MICEKDINEFFKNEKPIIGMLHLLPLPGSPIYDGQGLKKVIDRALKEAEALVDGGVDALEVENYNDPTYFPNNAPSETIAALSIVAHEIHKAFPDTTLGICLLADPEGSIAIAHSSGAKFVRATFFTEASVDVSGLALRKPHQIMRYRKFLDPSIKLFADVHIKHSAPLAMRPIEESAYDAAYFLADGVIISGKHTGFATPVDDVKKVRSVLPNYPIFIGSGTRKENVKELLEYATGCVVGTSFKYDGNTENTVDPSRVKEFIKIVEEVRKNK